MITTSNSSVKRSGTPNQLLDVLLHTMAMFRAVPRANRTFSPARNPIPCASSSTAEPLTCGPWRPWQSSALAASPGGNTYCAIPEGCATVTCAASTSRKRSSAFPCLRDMSQPSPIPARLLQRHQSQIARDLLATLKPFRSPDDQHESQCGQRTHSGMRLQPSRLGTLLHFLLDGLRQLRDRRDSVDPATPADRAVAGSPTGLIGNDSSCSRPASRHNLFLQRSPSLSATACN